MSFNNHSSPKQIPDPNFWAGKQVLITGHSGFKGVWLSHWLKRLGANVTGISLAPKQTPNLYTLTETNKCTTSHYCDLRNAKKTAELIIDSAPEVVFHLAAQALVRPSYKDPIETFSSNIMGTVHVLDALRHCSSVRTSVFITTDKVYHNLEHVYPYRESDTLGGYDPYSASKASSELVIESYRRSFLTEAGIAIASARAGNVIGGGDWSQDRLIPDAIKTWNAGKCLQIRYPNSVRPWQHVLEPLSGYLILAQHLCQNPELADAYNFGPETHDAATVKEVVEMAQATYGRGEISFQERHTEPHEAGLLSLDISKSRTILGVKPLWSLQSAIFRTIDWYRKYEAGYNAQTLCENDIEAYEAIS